MFLLFVIIGCTGLLNILESLESPFDENGLDDVKLRQEVSLFKNDIQLILANIKELKENFHYDYYDYALEEIK